MLFVVSSVVFLLFIVSCFLFLSKWASPIPYYPSNKHDIPLIVGTLKLKKGQTLIDLGAGDGIVIFSAARESNGAKYVAVEINPILILILHIRRFFHPNKQNIEIIRGDLFSMKFLVKSPVFFMYISPWLLKKAVRNIQKQFPRAPMVTYYYKIPGEKPTAIFEGMHPVFLYRPGL